MSDTLEDSYLDEILGPREEPHLIRWIGEDKAKVRLTDTVYQDKDSWSDRDNDARSPLEADLEDLDDTPR